MIDKIIKSITEPWRIIAYLNRFKIGYIIPDKIMLKALYHSKLGKPLDLKNPKGFNSKLQWLKLYDRRSVYTTMVDKYAVKKYVASIIGEKYIIPTLGVWNSFDEIDFDKLPQQFVLKCTHDSGGVVIVKDKNMLDIEETREKIESALKRDFYRLGREWPYKNVPRKIIAERYLVDESGYELKDYKVFNFNGEPKIIQVDYGRFLEHKRNIYTIDWELINVSIEYPNDPDHIIGKPKALKEMLYIAKELSKEYPHMRTDFYCVDDHVYFGEITIYHGSGFEIFTPASYEDVLGNYIVLPSRVLIHSN